ncbi:uncharacterized protein MONOS_14406 [Monocercomonoides exilis]|uniref:uncharacterized protein n=1 Tax=Monocercomonoides exilis TaxID=2049356 RepID=UPI00355A4F59|nr:hypothetical protein MONOS_14406 [Monocercomonoides exilis]|eukprot:MONOS_14406.1-p1 / transcript=MONOS_14406.1 / gene=MONOS_14406 / organism=Monocercomonoides_exilis_PA203 / gene_product=unspecified product / transcript_product=unspecified product / location=Mono_scaffold00996:11754-12128(-) / protein_length=98 / sequence_SO=supercontig / SO=protein_coding / is_pseudo=false
MRRREEKEKEKNRKKQELLGMSAGTVGRATQMDRNGVEMRGMVKKQTEESIVSRKEREESKRRLLQRLNLHHFSSTRAIFSSFGSPVFFEVPIANTT